MAWALWPILLFFGSSPNILLMGARGAEGGGNQGAETSITFYVGALICYGLAILGLLLRLRGQLLPALGVAAVWLNVLLAFVSITWSVEPAETLSRCIGLFGTTLGAVFLATFPPNHQLRTMTLAFGVIMGVCLLMIAVVPDIAVATVKGWNARGIFVHKNLYGWSSALFTIVAIGAYRSRSIARPIAGITIVLAATGALFSGSANGIMAVFLAVLTFGLLGFLRRTGRYRGVLTGIAFAGMIIVISAAGLILPYVLEIFDKTVTLSGRTRIWSALEPAMEQRWLEGWGFGGAFWKSDYAQEFMKYEYFAGNAQNGYFELYLQTGLVGTIIYFIPFIWLIRKMIRRSNNGDLFAEAIVVLQMIFLFMAVAAPIFMPVNQIYWFLIVVGYFHDAGLPSTLSSTTTIPPVRSARQLGTV